MYGKLENGILHYSPATVEWHGHMVNNPDVDKLLELGYLPVVYTEMPLDAPTGKYYESSWEQVGSEIKQKWILVEDSFIPETPTNIEERISILEQTMYRNI